MKINEYIQVKEDLDIVEFFEICEKRDVDIEYVEKCDVSELTGWTDQIDDILHDEKYGFFKEFDKHLYSTGFYEWREIPSHNFWLWKWMSQTILEDGLMYPFSFCCIDSFKYNEDEWNDLIHPGSNTEDKDNFGWTNVWREEGKKSYTLHPGTGRIVSAIFAGITHVPALIFSKKSHNITHGGIKIKNLDDLKINILDKITNKGFENTQLKIQIEWDEEFYSIDNPFELIKFNILLRNGDYHYLCWEWDSFNQYSLISKNSIPFKIYIGNCKTDYEYQECCKRILDSHIKHPKDGIQVFDGLNELGEKTHKIFNYDHNRKLDFYVLSKEETQNQFIVTFERFDGLRYEIPKKNNFKGFCLYTDSQMKWTRSVWEMFLYGNTNKAWSKYNDKIVFFNCEHSSWKYTNKPLKEHTGLLPKEYYEL